MRAEMPGILYKCRVSYQKMCPRHAMIDLPDKFYTRMYTGLKDHEIEAYFPVLEAFELGDAEDFVTNQYIR